MFVVRFEKVFLFQLAFLCFQAIVAAAVASPITYGNTLKDVFPVHGKVAEKMAAMAAVANQTVVAQLPGPEAAVSKCCFAVYLLKN